MRLVQTRVAVLLFCPHPISRVIKNKHHVPETELAHHRVCLLRHYLSVDNGRDSHLRTFAGKPGKPTGRAMQGMETSPTRSTRPTSGASQVRRRRLSRRVAQPG